MRKIVKEGFGPSKTKNNRLATKEPMVNFSRATFIPEASVIESEIIILQDENERLREDMQGMRAILDSKNDTMFTFKKQVNGRRLNFRK